MTFSVSDLYPGWTKALRDLGVQVSRWNLNDRIVFFDNSLIELEERGPNGETMARKALDKEQALQLAVEGLYAALYRVRPDVLLIVSAFFIPYELMDLARSTGTKVVVLFTESPYQDGRQLKTAEHIDLALINDPTNLEVFRSVVRTEYIPHSYRPDVHYPGPTPGEEHDLVFIGTGYPSRISFFEAMDLPDRTLLGGNWRGLAEDSPLRRFISGDIEYCTDNPETAELYRRSRAGLNLYRREADAEHLAFGWACGPREIEQAACGLFFLRDSRGEGDELFPMLPTFTDAGDASEQLRWWLDRNAEREKAAVAAREAVADRTFENQARALLRLIEG